MSEEGWEARMAAKAHARTEAEIAAAREAVLAAPEMEPRTEVERLAAIRMAIDKFIAEHGEHVRYPETPGPEIDPDVCRECYAWRVVWNGLYGWMGACKVGSGVGPHLGCAFGHEHHDDEVWLA